MTGGYLAFLLIGLVGLAIIDWRWKLVWVYGRRRTLATLAISVAFFLVWDATGIGHGIFFEGSNAWLVGVNLAPNLPIEEPVFLALLSYQALIAYAGFARRFGAKAGSKK